MFPRPFLINHTHFSKCHCFSCFTCKTISHPFKTKLPSPTISTYFPLFLLSSHLDPVLNPFVKFRFDKLGHFSTFPSHIPNLTIPIQAKLPLTQHAMLQPRTKFLNTINHSLMKGRAIPDGCKGTLFSPIQSQPFPQTFHS